MNELNTPYLQSRKTREVTKKVKSVTKKKKKQRHTSVAYLALHNNKTGSSLLMAWQNPPGEEDVRDVLFSTTQWLLLWVSLPWSQFNCDLNQGNLQSKSHPPKASPSC